jgi:hypothetical protein
MQLHTTTTGDTIRTNKYLTCCGVVRIRDVPFQYIHTIRKQAYQTHTEKSRM